MQFLIVFLSFTISLFTFAFALFTTASAHTGFQIVKMTADGFEPQELTTDTNSVVVFVNQDAIPRWPASNTHPTHEIYSDFDPKRPIEIGASWAFKPKKIGTFKFHDHLNPHLRGSLTVNMEPSLFGNNERQNPFLMLLDSIKKWFLNFRKVDKINSESSWQNLKKTYQGQAGDLGNIHDQAHLIGGLIYEEKSFEGLPICTSDFAFGCYHGFLDKAFEKSLDGLDRAEAACAKLGSSGPYGSCVHGIGHGIASFYQTNDLDSSLKSCQQLINGQQFCFDGVFMEFERAAPLELYSKDSPEQPCDNLAKNFSKEVIFACGRNQPVVLMDRFQFSFDEVAKICLESKSQPFKEACFDSLGFRSAQKGTSSGIISDCQKIKVTEFVARCTQAAAGELIFQEHPGWNVESTKACSSLKGNYQVACHEYLNNLIADYGKM